MYIFANLLPVVLFKRKEAMKNPKQALANFLKAYMRSIGFQVSNSLIGMVVFCGMNHQSKGQYSVAKLSLFLTPIVAGIFCEQRARQEEIMLYVLPRFLELVWNGVKKFSKGNINDIKGFGGVLFGLSIGYIVEVYMKEREVMKPKYKTIGKLLSGADAEADIKNKKTEKDEFGYEVLAKNKADLADPIAADILQLQQNISTGNFSMVFEGGQDANILEDYEQNINNVDNLDFENF